MKNTLTLKLIAALMAVLAMVSLSGCFAMPQQGGETDNTPVVTAADVSAGDVSASDVSGSDVSGSDVSASDVQNDADKTLEAYLNAFNTGDAEKLAQLTCSPAMEDFLKNNGKDRAYLVESFEQSIKDMKDAAGGYMSLEYTVVSGDGAPGDSVMELKGDLDSLSAGSGEKVQEVRIYVVNLTAKKLTSNGDVVSAADASQSADGQLRLYKFENKWYVFGD